jgi:hypothetical protein
MNQSNEMQPIVSTECPTPPRKIGHGKPARSGPPGNKNAVKHGVHSLTAMRKRGKIDRRTSFGRAFEARKKEYMGDLGDDASVMLHGIVEDTVWTEFYIASYDQYLAGLKSIICKGRPHPITEARTRLAAHKRENIKLMGLKRVTKALTVTDVLNGHDEAPASQNAEAVQ